MAKLPSSFCVFAALTVSSALAQEPARPGFTAAPLTPPSAPAAPSMPAPIEPPTVSQQAVPPAPGTMPLPGSTLVPGAPGATTVIPVTTTPALPPGTARTSEFLGDPLDLVLRTLAKQAGMNIAVSDQVTATGGTVNMRIEGKSPKEAIEIIVDQKGLIMEQGKGGVFQIKTAAEKAKEPTESGSYTLSYATAEKVVPLLQTQLQSGVAPQFDQRTNTLFYRENRSNLEKVKLFLVSIDRPTQQVMIEARLVEVTANPRQAYGINWGGVLGSSSSPQTLRYGGSSLGTQTIANAQNVVTNTVNGVTTTTTTPRLDVNGLPLQGTQIGTLPAVNTTNGSLSGTDFIRNGELGKNFLNAVGGQLAILSIPQASLTFRLLNEDADAEFLANPRVVTSNNQKAVIKIIRQQPVPQLNFNEQTAQAVFSGFQDKEFGNTLTVTPSINKDDFISMSVQPEISNKVADATFTFGGATVTSPIIDKRTLDSNVLIHSGETLAIGGLLQDEQTKARTKVPVLGDLPFVGYLFQEKINSRTKRNLLVFVTPTIIQQGYGTGLEDQVTGLNHSGEEYADPNGWRNNAKGAVRVVPTSNRSLTADYPKPGVAPAPKKATSRTRTVTREVIER